MASVPAPEGFLAGIHDRMAHGSRFQTVIRALFVPLRIKIPLEFATAALIGIMALSVWHLQQAEKLAPRATPATKRPAVVETRESAFQKPSKQGEVPPVTSGSERAKPGKPDTEREAQVKSPAPAPVKKPGGRAIPSDKVGAISELTSKEEVDSIADKAPSKTPAAAPSLPKPKLEAKATPMELVLQIETGAGPRTSKGLVPASAGRTGGDSKRLYPAAVDRKKQIQADEAAKGKGAPGSREKAADRLQRTDTGATLDEASPLPHGPWEADLRNIRDLVGLVNGKILSVRYHKADNRPDSVQVAMPAKSYGLFCQRLQRLTRLKGPAQALPKENLKVIRLRIRFSYEK
jgi:hypothetical protein